MNKTGQIIYKAKISVAMRSVGAVRGLIFFSFLYLFLCSDAFGAVIVVNGLTHEHHVAGGRDFKGVIQLKNTGGAAVQVKAYLQDYGYSSNGDAVFTDLKENRYSNGNWLHLQSNIITIEPYGTYDLTYELEIPDTVVLKGSRWSVVMIEPIGVKSLETKNNVSLSTIVRYAIQIITTDLDQSESKLEFNGAKLVKGQSKGTYDLELDIRNLGNLYHKLKVQLELYDAATGAIIGKYNSPMGSLLPGNSRKFHIALDAVPEGSYTAVVLAECRNGDIFGSNLELQLANDP